MKNPIVIALIVCVGSFMIAAAIIKVTPYCGGETECNIDTALYALGVLLFGFIGALLALVLCCYGISVGMMRLMDSLDSRRS